MRFCGFGEKPCFYGFGKKRVFAVLTETRFAVFAEIVILRFWRESMFLRFWRKTYFYGFGGKRDGKMRFWRENMFLLFLQFCGKTCFDVKVHFCGFDEKICFGRKYIFTRKLRFWPKICVLWFCRKMCFVVLVEKYFFWLCRFS